MARYVCALALLLAIPSFASTAPATENVPEQERIVRDFEERFGFKSIFWCVEALPIIEAGLIDAGHSGAVLPALAFDASAYCLARHFPTATRGECDQSVDAVQRLEAIAPGFLRDDTARNVLDACNVYVRG